MYQNITVDHEPHIGIVTINRPPANFFNHEVIAEIAAAYDELAATGARAIVLASQGRHFCAGADFTSGDAPGGQSLSVRDLYTAAVRLFRVEVPIVAAVQGAAVGGGLGLACSADFRVASPSSRFHANFSQLGFHPGFGLSASLPNIVGHQHAMEMLYTSRRVAGDLALSWGLADRITEPGYELQGAIELAQAIGAMAPLAVRSIKQTLRAELADRVDAVLRHELDQQEALWDTDDRREGIRANLAREQPDFQGR